MKIEVISETTFDHGSDDGSENDNIVAGARMEAAAVAAADEIDNGQSLLSNSLGNSNSSMTEISTNQKNKNNKNAEITADQAVAAIVQHYNQPIHYDSSSSWPKEASSSSSSSSTLPPVLDYWWSQLDAAGSAQHLATNNGNILRHQRENVLAQLVALYPKHIHPLLLSTTSNARGAAAVLTHFELFLSHGISKIPNEQEQQPEQQQQQNETTRPSQQPTKFSASSPPNNDKLFQAMHLLATDITEQTQKAVHFLDMSRQESNNDQPNDNEPNIEDINSLLHPEQGPDWKGDPKSAQQMAEEQKHNQQLHKLTQTVILPMLIRILQHTWSLTAAIVQRSQQRPIATTSDDGNMMMTSNRTTLIRGATRNQQEETFLRQRDNDSLVEWQHVQAHCAMALLAFGRTTTLGPAQIYPECVNTIENVTSFVVHSPLQQENGSDSSSKTTKMEWNELQLESHDWQEPSRRETVLAVWRTCCCYPTRHSTEITKEREPAEKAESATTIADLQREFLFPQSSQQDDDPSQREKWSLQLARACRAHFFGRDMYAVEESPMTNDDNNNNNRSSSLDRNVEVIPRRVETQTRLHLGRTVTEEKQQSEKPFQRIPSRVFAVMQFISLLPPNDDALGDDVLAELWPILYELLSAHRPIYVGLGATCLCRLLQPWISTDTTVLSSSKEEQRRQVLENFRNLLETAIKSERQSSVATMLGLALQVLHELNPPSVDRSYRLRALQQWFTMLNQNQTLRLPFSWACLVSGVLPTLHWFATRGKNSASELGRLGLMAILPLIQMESMSQDEMFGSPFTNEVQWLALTAFANLLMVANTVMPRHGGKIMSALLVCQGDDPRDQRTRLWAPHVSALAFASCGSRGEEIVDKIVESGEYQDVLVRVAENIKKEAADVKHVVSCH